MRRKTALNAEPDLMLVLPACLLGSLGLSPPSSRQWLRHEHLNTAVWAMEALWASEVRAPLWGSSRLLLRRWSCRTVSPDPAVAGRRRTDDVSTSPCVFLAEGPCCFGRRWDSLGANGASPRTASDWPAGDPALHSVSRVLREGVRCSGLVQSLAVQPSGLMEKVGVHVP